MSVVLAVMYICHWRFIGFDTLFCSTTAIEWIAWSFRYWKFDFPLNSKGLTQFKRLTVDIIIRKFFHDILLNGSSNLIGNRLAFLWNQLLILILVPKVIQGHNYQNELDKQYEWKEYRWDVHHVLKCWRAFNVIIIKVDVIDVYEKQINVKQEPWGEEQTEN